MLYLPFRPIPVVLLASLLSLLVSITTTAAMALLNYATFTRLPKLIAFDLDGTLWTPDMYQLWGGGAPFSFASNGKDLKDRQGQAVRLLGHTAAILHDLHSHPELQHIQIAWVSCTDEPLWAQECLEKFTTTGGVAFDAIVHSKQVFKANKQSHFQRLHALYPEIAYSDMLFFDNEYGNIRSVSQLGVHCYHCEDGMTLEAWQEGLHLVEKQKK